MNRAIFWDRDGVINQTVLKRSDGAVHASPQKFGDLKLTEGIGEILNKAKAKGFLNIVITNQPDIARGRMSREELDKMHILLKQALPSLDAIYVCPHQDADNCQCRKPKPGMLLDAAKDFNIDLSQSYMVGDSQRDIGAAKAAGAKSILLKTYYNQEVTDADYQIETLNRLMDLLD